MGETPTAKGGVNAREMARRYRSLLENLPCVAYLAAYGPTGQWFYVSPRVEELLGFTPEELMSDPDVWWRNIHADDQARVEDAEERSARERVPFDNEYRFYKKGGDQIWVRDTASIGAVSDEGEVVVEGILTDITSQKRAEGELFHRATHDDLTGVLNRRGLEERLALHAESSTESRGALIILDIDRLKFVNDSLGHAMGDQVLRFVASALNTGVTDGELLGRLGGDEFAVFLPQASESDAVARAGELLRAVRAPAEGPSVTASAGVAAHGEGSAIAPGDLMISADVALYEAKSQGGDRIAVFSDHEAGRLAWIERIKAALDRGDMRLSAQPIVDLATRESVAEELLGRLHDGERFIQPSGWLAPAEGFGLIQRIDRMVVEQALDLVASGRKVSVNLSGRSVGDPDLTRLIESRLEESGADPQNLILEITESMTAAGEDVLHDFGERVERIGCELAIDDFGTGFGSFTYLRHLSARYLKIDRAFVQGAAHSPADQRLVRSIVAIAERLGMRTVAEGIEDEETAEAMRRAGVPLGQGFHLGRPEPLEQPRAARVSLPTARTRSARRESSPESAP